MKMPYKQDFIAALLAAKEQGIGAMLAFIMAYLRGRYNGGAMAKTLIDALMCAMIAWFVRDLLDFTGLSSNLAYIASVFIGYIGTDSIGSLIKNSPPKKQGLMMPELNKQRKAFLDMLAWSEGTDKPGQPTKNHGYDVIVGGSLFSNYADHPRKLVSLPKLGIKSTAAGRYQLLAKWWDAYRKQLGLKDFSPESQDLVALQQIKERGALTLIDEGDIRQAIDRCSNIWASLPGAGYGQFEHKVDNLLAKFKAASGFVAEVKS